MISAGIDLIEVERIKKSMKNPRFLSEVFSEEERVFFQGRKMSPQTVAANFCCKEAFAKALGTGIRGFSLSEISVLRDAAGAPYFTFSGRCRELVEQRGMTFTVSISHTKEYATAVVVAYPQKGEKGESI